jgi:hypothetical protein
MKRILIAILVLVTCYSCKEKGDWSDNIHLSGKKFTFNADGDSVLITTKGKWWWLISANLDSTYTHIPPNAAFCDYQFTDSSFQIVRKSCDTLIVKMNENNTGASRLLVVGLEAGDYFDAIQITQRSR